MRIVKPKWADSPTEARQSISDALGVVDNLLSLVKNGQGKPSAKERALFAAAVVFTYGVWENFAEQIAIELAKHVSRGISAEKVPQQIRSVLEKKTAWELTVTPGWRTLWAEHVRLKAIGDDEEKWGMNTAKAGQVENLLQLAGAQFPFQKIDTAIIPKHLSNKADVKEAINALVELRGEIVHTGTVPDDLRKAHVHAWRGFVEGVTKAIDEACRQQCKSLVA